MISYEIYSEMFYCEKTFDLRMYVEVKLHLSFGNPLVFDRQLDDTVTAAFPRNLSDGIMILIAKKPL